MASIFENTQSRVLIHLLHDDTLTPANKQNFIRTAEKYSQGIEFHNLTDYKASFQGRSTQEAEQYFTIGALFRLSLPYVTDLSKIIYLDCDILVNLDINELWNIDLEGNCFAGVVDGSVSKSTFWTPDYIRRILNHDKLSSYINSGVLVMNLEKLRQGDNLINASTEWLKVHYYTAPYPDQDFINSLFYGRIKLLDGRFNRHMNLDGDLSGTIIHTIWSKPWRRIADTQCDKLYWRMFLKSAWGENIPAYDLALKLFAVADLSAQRKSFFDRHLERILRTLWVTITFRNSREIIRLIIADTLHKIRLRVKRS